MTPFHARAGSRRRRRRWLPATQAGSLSLEFALALPVLVLALGALLQGVTLLRDLLVVQEAARVGARIAATTTSDEEVVAGVRDALPARDLTVAIAPPRRAPGDAITVTVTLTGRFGPFEPTVTGTAVYRGEPVLDPAAGT